MNETAKEETTVDTSNTSEESETRPEKTGNERSAATDALALMMEMPLRDVPGRLDLLASAVDKLNTELAYVIGAAMGAGWTELHALLEVIGTDYIVVEQMLSNWKMDLKHNRKEEFKETPGEF